MVQVTSKILMIVQYALIKMSESLKVVNENKLTEELVILETNSYDSYFNDCLLKDG